MCGICGLIDFTGQYGAGLYELVRRMTASLQHRGPDAEGHWSGPGASLGHRRLSIIDLAGSSQPMLDDSGRYVLVFNGEIYNYLELKQELKECGFRFATAGDTEVLLTAFMQYGTECLHKLNGMFAFAVWDRKTRRLFAARDRLGVKPLFYGTDRNGTFAFASELQALRGLPFDTSIRSDSLCEYLRHGFIQSPKTIFQRIHELRPGHFMIYDSGGLRVERYWEPPLPDRKSAGRPMGDLMEELRELFHSAVRIRLRSDVPLGAFLSGGLDSSIVVAAMKQLGETSIHTFSIGFGGRGFDESPYARSVAAHLGTHHHERRFLPGIPELLNHLVRHYGQPYGDSSAVPTWHLCQMTREHVTVALSGDGGDELFCGYRRYMARRMLAWYRLVPTAIRHGALTKRIERLPEGTAYYGDSVIKKLKLFVALDKRVASNPHDIYPACFSTGELQAMLGLTSEETCRILETGPLLSPKRTAGMTDIETMMAVDLLHYLPDDILTKVDRASMAHALEVRSPFMDYRLVEFAARLPLAYKLRGLTTKYILRKAFERDLPEEPIKRAKHGFATPLGDEFLGPLQYAYRDTVLGRKSDCLVDPDIAEDLLTEHLSGRADHSHKLWLLLFLHAWAHWWKQNDAG